MSPVLRSHSALETGSMTQKIAGHYNNIQVLIVTTKGDANGPHER